MGAEPPRFYMELAMGIEPMTSPLPRECSTTELREPILAQAPEALSPKTLSPNLNPYPIPRAAKADRSTPTGNRTPVYALRTRRPRPLDDGGGDALSAQAQRPEAVSLTLRAST